MKRLTHIFLIIQWLIFISYMTMDLYSRSMGFYSALLKYTGILLCCFYTWTLYTHSQIPLSPYWLAACVIVLFADYFLLFTPQSLAGVMTFCMDQCLYLCAQKGGKFLPGFILFSGLWGFPIYFIFKALKPDAALLSALSMIYMLMLTINIGIAIHNFVKYPNISHLFTAIGLIFYILCDINVGLINFPKVIGIAIDLPKAFTGMSACAMWFFYLPAQIFLSLGCFFSIHGHGPVSNLPYGN